jgi:aminoglycoside phosphotransferase (APT) family kinase protein
MGARQPVPIHGSPHINQWLDDGAVLGLVDFDRYAMGDPELDAATLLTELDSESEMVTPVQDVAEALAAGYATAGVTLDPHWLAVYRLHKSVAKVARTAYSLRPDGDARAATHLEALVATGVHKS